MLTTPWKSPAMEDEERVRVWGRIRPQEDKEWQSHWNMTVGGKYPWVMRRKKQTKPWGVQAQRHLHGNAMKGPQEEGKFNMTLSISSWDVDSTSLTPEQAWWSGKGTRNQTLEMVGLEGRQDGFMWDLESEEGRTARENTGRKARAGKKGGERGCKGQRHQRRLGSRELKWEEKTAV